MASAGNDYTSNDDAPRYPASYKLDNIISGNGDCRGYVWYPATGYELHNLGKGNPILAAREMVAGHLFKCKSL